MCGIAGYVEKKVKVNKEKFEQMVDLIAYRGPDDRGILYDGKVALGHRRLAIIDVTQDGHQPFVYDDRYVVVYNGEIYNYIELRENLEKRGYRFKTKTDTEVLVAAYSEYGERCLSMLNGMWAFAIYDREKKEVFLSRDRYGVKPLYYTNAEGGFIFASEIKQILHMEDEKKEANKERLKAFLLWGITDVDEHTMFEGIYQLQPGEYAVYSVDGKSLFRDKYYDVAVIAGRKTTRSYEDTCALFKDIYEDSVRIRHRSDVKVGYCLSGGLDSSANVCMAHEIFPATKEFTVSSCSEYSEYDEQEYADAVVNHTGCNIYKLYPKCNEMQERLDDLIWHMDEPFASTSIYASRCVFEAAKGQGLTVMLDGQGADELLAGYSDAYAFLFRELLARGKFKTLRDEIAAFKTTRFKTDNNGTLKEKVLSPLLKKIFPKSITRIIRRRNWAKNDISKIIPDSDKLIESTDLPIGNKQYIINQMTNLRMLLRFEDRNTMTFSIESRLPFLDYRLVEMLCESPIYYKIRNGMTKAVMRDALCGILPEMVRKRVSKLGFVTAEDRWFSEYKEYFDSEFRQACKTLSGILDSEKAIEWWDKQGGLIKAGDHFPWRIICASHWVDMFGVEI